jgi:hypothetical protein
MKTEAIKVCLLLIILPVLAAGCSNARPARSPYSFEAPPAGMTPSPPQRQETPNGDGEAFRALEAKMDEYQNLMAVCESLPRTEENKEMRGSCATRLKAMSEELIDLTKAFQDDHK